MSEPESANTCSSFSFGDLLVVLHPLEEELGQGMLFSDGILDDSEAFDHTGLAHVWPASEALCRFLSAHRELVRAKRVMEIGAGAGLPVLLAHRVGAARVLGIDSNQCVVNRLARSFKLNGATSAGCAHCMDWSDGELIELAVREQVEILIAADVVYPLKEQTTLIEALRRLLSRLPAIKLVLAIARRDAVTHETFMRNVTSIGLVSELSAGEDRANDPLYGEVPILIFAISRSRTTEGGQP